MHFLTTAIRGMRRRLFSTFITLLCTLAILSSFSLLGLWSYWIHDEQSNLKIGHIASIFMEPLEDSEIEKAISKIKELDLVASVRRIDVTEFRTYLENHFPDLTESIGNLGLDVIPQMLEVEFQKGIKLAPRVNTIDEIYDVAGVNRVDDGARLIEPTKKPLNWLAQVSLIFGFGLWLVLVAVASGHFQAILMRDRQEMRLIRSFGGNNLSIVIPWMWEALFYATASSIGLMAILWASSASLATGFNQFFDIMGFESIQLSPQITFAMGVFVFLAGFLAHFIGGTIAVIRSQFV